MANDTEVIDPELMAKRAKGWVGLREVGKRLDRKRSSVNKLVHGVDGKPPVLESFKDGTRRKVWVYILEEFLYKIDTKNLHIND